MKISALCIVALATAGILLPGDAEVRAAQVINTININRAVQKPDSTQTVKKPAPTVISAPPKSGQNRMILLPPKGLQTIPARIPPKGTSSPSGSTQTPSGTATTGTGTAASVPSEPGVIHVPTLKVIGLPGGPPPDKPATGPFSPFTTTIPTLKVIGLPGGPPPDKPATGPFSPKVITVTTLKVIGK